MKKKHELTRTTMNQLLLSFEIALENGSKLAYEHYKCCKDMYIETLNMVDEEEKDFCIFEFCCNMFISLVYDFL